MEPILRECFGDDVWEQLDEMERRFLCNAEYSYQRNKDLRDFDFAQASICMTKAIEVWIDRRVVEPLGRRFPKIEVAVNKLVQEKKWNENKLTLGQKAVVLKWWSEKSWGRDPLSGDPAPMGRDLSTIARNYRGEWFHEKPMPRETFEELRDSVVKFFKRGGRWVVR